MNAPARANNDEGRKTHHPPTLIVGGGETMSLDENASRVPPGFMLLKFQFLPL